jgi:O-antigen ligase
VADAQGGPLVTLLQRHPKLAAAAATDDSGADADARRFRAAIASALLVASAATLLVLRGPVVSLAVVAAVGVAVALVVNVELAALTFISVAPFESYAKAVSGSAVKALGGVLFVAWLYHVIARRNRVELGHPVTRAAGVLLAALMASTVLHPNGVLGSQVLIRYLSYISAFVVLVDCLQNQLSHRRAAQVYVSASWLAAVFGLIDYFQGSLRSGGPVGDPNDFAFFLIAALALCIGLRAGARRRWVYDLTALTLGLAILATLSRGALIGVAVMLLFAVATRQIPLRALIITASLGAAVLLGVLLIDPTQLSDSLHAKGVVAQQNVDERVIRWQVAAEMTYDHPLLGLGPAGFRENYDRYLDFGATDALDQLDVAHETYLEVSSELGLIGLAAFVSVIGFGFRGAWRAATRRGPDAALAGSVCVGLVGTLVAAAFLTEQYYLPLWLLAALGAAAERSSRGAAG